MKNHDLTEFTFFIPLINIDQHMRVGVKLVSFRAIKAVASLLLLVLLLNAVPVRATDFTWFKVNEFEGWIEDTPQGKQIKLLPFVGVPGTGFWLPRGAFEVHSLQEFQQNRGLELTSDGRLRFGYRIVTEPIHLPSNLGRSIEEQVNLPRGHLSRATVSFVAAEYSKIELEIGGEIVAGEEFSVGNLSGSKEGYFYFDVADFETINRIREGDFRYVLTMTYPLTTFSSIELQVDGEIVSNTWSRALREIIQRKRRTGFSLGPISFGSTIRRSYVIERIESGSTNSIRNNTSIVMRDPTPEQLARVNAILGIASTTRQQALTMHQQAAAAALAAGKPNLADAHTQYAQSLQLSSPSNGEFTGAVLRRLENMPKADALSFFAAGFKSQEQSASGYYRYNGTTTTTTETRFQSSFSEFIISNSDVQAVSFGVPMTQNGRYTAYNDAELANDRRIFNLDWQTPVVMTPQWVRGVDEAMQQRRFGDVRYAFQRRLLTSQLSLINVNRPVGGQENTVLHTAVQYADLDLLRFMLNRGANPRAENRFGETPLELASEFERQDVVELLTEYRDRYGEIAIRISHPGIRLVSVDSFMGNPRFLRLVELEEDGVTELRIGDYPMFMHFGGSVTYEAIVSNLQLQSMRFPYRVLQTDGVNSRIQAQALLRDVFRIEHGERKRRERELTFVGPLSGFSFEDEDRALPMPGNQPRGFRF